MGTLLQGPGGAGAVTLVRGVGFDYPRPNPEGTWEQTLQFAEDSKVILCPDGDDLYAFVTVGYPDKGVWRRRAGVWEQVVDTVDGAFDPNSATVYDGKIYVGNSTGAVFYAYDLLAETLATIDVSGQIPPSDDCNMCAVFEGLLFIGTLQSGGDEGRLYSFDGATMTPVAAVSGSPSGTQVETAVVHDGELWTSIQYDGTSAEVYSLAADLTPTLRATRTNAYRLNLYAFDGELYATHGGDDHITLHLERWNGSEFELVLGPRGPQDANIRPEGKDGLLFWVESKLVSWKLGETSPRLANGPDPSAVRAGIAFVGDDLYYLGVGGTIDKTRIRATDDRDWRYTLLHPEGPWTVEHDFGLDDIQGARALRLGDDLYVAIGTRATTGDDGGIWRRRDGVWTQRAISPVGPFVPNSMVEFDGKILMGNAAVPFYVFDPADDSLTMLDIEDDPLVGDDHFAGPTFNGEAVLWDQSSSEDRPAGLATWNGNDFTLRYTYPVAPAGSFGAVVFQDVLWAEFHDGLGPEATVEIFTFDEDFNPTLRWSRVGRPLAMKVLRGQLCAIENIDNSPLYVWNADTETFDTLVASLLTVNAAGGLTQMLAEARGAIYGASSRWREDDPGQPSQSPDRPDSFQDAEHVQPAISLTPLGGVLYWLGSPHGPPDTLKMWRAKIQAGEIVQPAEPPAGLTVVEFPADENPLSDGGDWQRSLEPDVNFDGGYWTGAVKTVGGAASADLADPDELGYLECSACRTDVDEEDVVVAARLVAVGNSYSPAVTARVQNAGAADAREYVLYVYDANNLSLYVLADGDFGANYDLAAPFALAAGDWIALSVVGNRLAAFVSHDGETWEQAGATVEDDTISGPGSVGIEFEEAIGTLPYGAIDRFAWAPAAASDLPAIL